jgi:hypothetical protein
VLGELGVSPLQANGAPDISAALTSSAGSVPKFVAQKPDSVKIRSKFTADRKSFTRIDQIDEFQGARADHWRGGSAHVRPRLMGEKTTCRWLLRILHPHAPMLPQKPSFPAHPPFIFRLAPVFAVFISPNLPPSLPPLQDKATARPIYSHPPPSHRSNTLVAITLLGSRIGHGSLCQTQEGLAVSYFRT